jgi:hypothetical protein
LNAPARSGCTTRSVRSPTAPSRSSSRPWRLRTATSAPPPARRS